MKHLREQISCIFNSQNLNVLLQTCSTTALTMQSIMLTKIVHRTRDCVEIIAGVQRIDGPLQVKYWGDPDLVTPAASTPVTSSLRTCPCVAARAWTEYTAVVRSSRVQR